MKIYDRIIALFEADYSAAKGWFQGDALPFVENLFKQIDEDAVVALKPVAEQALADVVPDLTILITGGVGAAMAAAIPQALQLAKAAGFAVEGAAQHDLVTAVHAAVANAQAKLQPAA